MPVKNSQFSELILAQIFQNCRGIILLPAGIVIIPADRNKDDAGTQFTETEMQDGSAVIMSSMTDMASLT